MKTSSFCSRQSRRHFLSLVTAAAATGWLSSGLRLGAATPAAGSRYKVGVCDWMILRRQRVSAFTLAKEIGADGIVVDMGGLGNRDTFDNKLADPATRREFLDAARENGVEISSLAMSGFYGQSFPERPGVDRMVQDCIDTMVAMGVKIAFLPLGVPGNLVERPEQRPAVISRLRDAGARAEKAGVVIAVETMLPAAEEAVLLDGIGSPGIRSSFNVANAIARGQDVSDELRALGRDRIAQIHATDTDGVWLEHNPRINLPVVKRTLDAMGWSGWLLVERSRDVNDVRNVKRNFGANVAHLKAVFQAPQRSSGVRPL